VCAAQPEYEYVKSKFQYPDHRVKLLGFCRFDNLNNYKLKERQILIMPSWREWLAHVLVKEREKAAAFIQSDYYHAWNGLLNDREFHNMLQQNNLTAVFYPHRNMQRFLERFTPGSPHIIVADWRSYDVQDL